MNPVKLFFVFLCGCFANIIFAQPILTQNNTVPQANQNFTVTNINYIQPGSSGTNQTWDFSTATSTGTSSINVYHAWGTPHGYNFPSATVAIGHEGYTHYHEINSNEWNYYGFHTTLSISYSNPQTMLSFPFSYTNQITDSFYCIFNVGYLIYRKGLAVIEADGYGNLILPSGTYTNVLRVHYTINYNDSSQNGVSNYTHDYYYWYKPWNHNPIAYMMTNPYQKGYYLNNIFTDVDDENSTFLINIYPNPSNNLLNIALDSFYAKNIYMSISDLVGKEILSENIRPGENKKTIDVSSLSCGTYILNVYSSDKMIDSKKIIIE